MKNKESEIYWEEFSLNLKHQIEELNEVTQVGYKIDNCLCVGILIPKKLLPF